MGIRNQLKSLLHVVKQLNHRSFSRPLSPVPNAPTLYRHANKPIQPPGSHPRAMFIDRQQEPLEFVYKPYTMASGVVIPPEFSYEREKEVYQVYGLRAVHGLCVHQYDDEFDDDDISETDDDDDTISSEYSFQTLNRMTTLALAAHEPGNPSPRKVSPRPLPEIPGPEYARGAHRGIRILSGDGLRKVHGIRLTEPGAWIE